MNELTVPDVLEKAAKVIETRGWHRGGYVPGKYGDDFDPDTCPVCVLGAINVATDCLPDFDICDDGFGDRFDAANALAIFLGFGQEVEEAEDVVGVVGDTWNDRIAMSAEQVITTLRECAASLKAGA